MGIDQWNIYALSYGTDLALQTLRDHPEGIRSVVLDSVLPPQANLMESGWASAAGSFTAIFDGCAADPACAAAFPDVRNEFTRLVNELSASPLRVTVDDAAGKPTDVVIDGYKLASGVVVAAAQTPGQLARIPAMIHKLATGDPTDVAKALTELVPPNILSFGLMYGVLCSESVAHTTAKKVLAVGKQALPEFPDAVLAAPAQVPSVLSDCETWSVPAAPPEVSSPARSDVPVLLASGSFDSATPPNWAAEAAQTLPNSRHLVFPGTGHEVALSTPDAAACFLGRRARRARSCCRVLGEHQDNPAGVAGRHPKLREGGSRGDVGDDEHPQERLSDALIAQQQTCRRAGQSRVGKPARLLGGLQIQRRPAFRAVVPVGAVGVGVGLR
jgi:pimeloyl-ACP methyl ester carboxylesterase